MRGTHRFLFFVALILLVMVPASAHPQQWSGILDPSRATNWSNVGVASGIANRTIVCSALNPGATTAQINSAIAACPSGQVVLLNAGTYSGLGGIVFGGHSGVTLRGAGANRTFLVFTGGNSCHGYFADVCIDSSDTNWGGGPSNTANWIAGYTPGTTSITLSSVTKLKVGFPLILDQVDDASDRRSVFVCQSTSTSPPCSLEGNNNNGQRNNHDQVQIVQVVSCGTANIAGQTCNGNKLTINPAIRMANWSAGKSPGAWWANNPVSGDGIESLSMDHTGSNGNRGTEIFNCIDCWVKSIRDIGSGKAHVEVQNSARVTIQDNYFYLTQNSISQSYGAESFSASDVLIQNNVIQFVASPVMINGSCSGCVVAYNFSINDYLASNAGYLPAATNQHTAGIDMLLYEGNVGAATYGDNFHGTHNLVTFFRNRWVGNQPACYNGTPFSFSLCSSNQITMDIRAYSRLYNIIGNVLGQRGVNTTYQGRSKPIYSLGSGNTEGSVTVPADSLVGATLMRWGNYDVVTGAVRWCGNSSDPGWTTICGGISEVPTGLTSYANAVPATTMLPASFYLSTKPSWWPSGKAWPAIGPDVTGGNVPNVGGHAYTIPAQDCYLNVMGGPADGTGPVLSFNAATCYTNSSSALPAPPTGLQAIVH